MKIFSNKIILVLILCLAAFFRLYGLDWDKGQHLHPDERFLTMVATAIKIPNTFVEYLNPQVSTMNPYNAGYNFFVYGTFPLYLTKIIGEFFGYNNYGDIHFVGRILSALFDVATVFLIYLIANKIYSQKSLDTKYKIQNTPLLAAFFYAIMVLPIQLSHFFAVDTFLTFFLVLSFYLLVLLLTSHSHNPTHISLLIPTLLGISYGLALACKISALYFLPIIGLGFLYFLLKNKKIFLCFFYCLLFTVCCLLSFRIVQPSAFATASFLNFYPNPKFLANLKELQSFSDPNTTFPPALQWKVTKPLIFPLKNMILWGMGLPLGIVSLMATGYEIVTLLHCLPCKGYIVRNKILNTKYLILNTLIVLWISGLFIYQGLQFSKTMRYFLPIYPFLALLCANFVSEIPETLKKFYLPRRLAGILHFTFYISVLIYPVSFMSIYSHPVTRVTASEWIYQNIPAGATVVNEEWDDPLPLILPNYPFDIYKGSQVFMYDPDTTEKWTRINTTLKKADYIFLTSNRAYGPTIKIPSLYPKTINYYQNLFNSTGEFKKVAEFTSRPCFPPIGKPLFCFNDDNAEESFTVYDHPKVMIFKKTK